MTHSTTAIKEEVQLSVSETDENFEENFACLEMKRLKKRLKGCMDSPYTCDLPHSNSSCVTLGKLFNLSSLILLIVQ